MDPMIRKVAKYLGSYIDTEKDIQRRKQLSIITYNKYKKVLETNKISLKTRLSLFNTLVLSVFLCNSELWTLTKQLENNVNAFHRKMLKRMLKIYWPCIISNADCYERCK